MTRAVTAILRAPKPAKRLAWRTKERAAARARLATATLRRRPDYLVIVAMKSGTSSLHASLADHPNMHAPAVKEVHYFSRFYERGPTWYRSNFPHRALGGVTGEATPYYLFHPLVPERAQGLLPAARLVVILRDPVERAFSHYRHMVRDGTEKLVFEEALDAEPERLAPGWKALSRGCDPDAGFMRFSYTARGLYADQLERWYEHFEHDQILVVPSDALFTDPRPALETIMAFVGLDPGHAPTEIEQRHIGQPGTIAPETRARLEATFAESNRRLRELTGISFDATPLP